MELKIGELRAAAEAFLREDAGRGDITTEALVPENHVSTGIITAKDPGVIAGMPLAREVFRTLDKNIQFIVFADDGKPVESNFHIAEISGKSRAILTGERTALNVLGRLSGIATLTRKYIDRVKDYNVKIIDTRKTAPGLRLLEKYAVRTGGGTNHRMGLHDAVLIKDNHIKITGESIENLIKKAAQKTGGKVKIEIEASDFKELRDAMEGGPDIIMLDNMSPHAAKEAVKLIRKTRRKILIEISGKINLCNILDYAAAEADMISVGELTHSAKNLDFSLNLEK